MKFLVEWARCAPMLQATLDYEGHLTPLTWYLEQVVAGTMQFWPAQDSAGITQIIETQHGKVCVIELIGGKASTLEAMLPKVESWARNRGCARVSFWGRMGWSRLFPGRTGYKVDRVRLSKTL